MGKVRFFLLIEMILVTLALFDTLSSDSARLVVAMIAGLLLVRYVSKSNGLDVFLISSLFLFLLIFVFNIYFLVAVLLAVGYGMLTFFSRYRKRSQYTYVVLDHEPITIDKKKNKWWSSEGYFQNRFAFEDVNINRFFGNDVLDLEEALVQGQDNVVTIQKIYGDTKVVVPIDVEVALSVTSMYGRVDFLGVSAWDLRNENLFLMSPHYQDSRRRVKIVTNTLFGNVEVVRV